MPKIIIKNINNTIIKTNDINKSLLDNIHENYIDWMHACGKKGRCTTCKAVVEEGMENLSGLTIHEERFREKNALADNERLTCQAMLKKDTIVVSVPESGKLPHMVYTD